MRNRCICFSSALLLLCPIILGAAPAPRDPLVGLWATELRFPTGPSGRLVLRRTGAGWRATVGTISVEGVGKRGEIDFAFPAHAELRLFPTPGRTPEAFWVQPATAAGESTTPFASPVRLQAAGLTTWRGAVEPLPARFTLYLKIFPAADGSLLAAFRNPEQNANGGTSQFAVSRVGDTIRFSAPGSGSKTAHEATLLRAPDRIRIAWPAAGRTLELERRTPTQASGFFPRPPGAPPYVYRRPQAVADGWATSRAGETGFNEAALTALVREIAEADPAARPPQLIHSLLVARHGRLVLEEYFFGYDRDTPHDLRSASKTFVSVAMGAAMARGARVSPDSRVYELLAGLGPFSNPDPRKSQITLAQLMTHSAGLACDDNDDASPGNEERMQAQITQPDWWKYTLDLPVAHDPGTRYAYCSANINLVGGALTAVTKTWLPALFDREIARPLQFGTYYWNLMPTGEGYGGGGVHMRPRDLLKIGQMYLDDGRWKGQRIVDASWVRDSTAPRIDINPATTGLSEEEFGNAYLRSADALAWHVQPIQLGARTYREYQAGGNGGQMLIVLPELDMVVVMTGGNYGQGGVWTRWRERIVGEKIIGAILPSRD